MSIATKRGDGGQTSLVGGDRVSKGEPRVEAYGSIDELNSVMGFARSICDDAEVCELVKAIQRELFALGAAVATPVENRKKPPPVSAEMVEILTGHVHRIEAIEGVLSDWSLPGEHPAASAFDVARTVCRRAERDSGPADGLRGAHRPARFGLFEPPLRPLVVVRPADRSARRPRRLVARRETQG